MNAPLARDSRHDERDEPMGEAHAPDMLFGFWYRALQGRDVGPRKLVKASVLDTATSWWRS